MALSSMILMLVVGVVLTGLFWKLNWLKIVTIKKWDLGNMVMNGGDIFEFSKLSRGRRVRGAAVIEINGFLKFVIPEWMGDPPINYAICFLIICSGLSIILFTYGKFIG